MHKFTDIRYEATSSDTSATEQAIFPIYIASTQPTASKAVEDVKRINEEFHQFMQKSIIKGGLFKRYVLEEKSNNWSSKFTIQQLAKNQVKVILGCAGLLVFEENINFWNRASAIATCTDAIQEFCMRSHDKQIEISVDLPRIQIRKVIASQSGSINP